MKVVAVLVGLGIVLLVAGGTLGRGFEWLAVLGLFSLLAAVVGTVLLLLRRIFRPRRAPSSATER